MGIRATVPQVEIASLAVKVELIPETPERQSLYEEEPEPLRVRVFLGEDPNKPRSTEKLVEIGPNDKEVITVTLFVHREPRTPAGTEISVQVIDVESNRSYSSGLFVRAARDLD